MTKIKVMARDFRGLELWKESKSVNCGDHNTDWNQSMLAY